MTKVLFLVIILLPVKLALAQILEIDSLTRALEGHPQQDTIRLQIMLDLAYDYYMVDPDKGLELADEAIALAKKLNRPTQLAAAYNHKGSNHWAKEEDSLGLLAGEEALKIHRENNNKLGVGKALNNLGLNYYNLSQFKKALQYHMEALSIFQELNFKLGVVHSYSNAGVVYLSLSDYPKALDNFLKGVRAAEGVDSLLFANISSNIGLVYKNMKAYDKALKFQEDALRLYLRANQKQGQANALGNLGTLYDEMGSPDKAIASFKESLALNTEIGNNRRIASDLVNMGTVYHKMKNYPVALDYVQQSQELYEQTSDKENTSFTLTKLVEIYLDAPDLLQKKHGARSERVLFNYLQRAADLAEESGSLQSQQMVWEMMSNAFQRYGNEAMALEAYKKHIALRDSIYNTEKATEIARQQIQFDFERKETQLKSEHEKNIAVAEAKIERQKTVGAAMIIIALLVVIAATAAFILDRKRKEAERKRLAAEFTAQMVDTEMKALRAQMNPHFIFNSLNAISNFIGANKLTYADDYLMRFSKIIRMILEYSEHKEITLADDLKALELYIQLEAMRLKNQFTYEIHMDENLDTENTLVPPLILQPFVENAIWHGVSKRETDGKIAVIIRQQSGQLVCTIEDNGPGRQNGVAAIASGTVQNKKSLGIRITQSRINILNQQGKSGADVAFTDLPEGLRVTVSLPLLHKF